MRLRLLYIEEYKNIKKQAFDFSNNSGYVALMGLNGSGKSNLLEAIALIFYGIFNNSKVPFKYVLQYEYNGKVYLRSPRIAIIDSKKVKKTELIYPSSIIACYSGEDSRLWNLAFEEYTSRYFAKVIDGSITIPELVYINKHCWNIALLSLFCSEKVNVKSFLKNTFNIDDLDDVEVSFSFGNSDHFKDHAALTWIKRIQSDCLNDNNKATIKSFLSYEMPLLPKQSKDKTLFYYLYLLTQPERNEDRRNSIDKYITNINIVCKGIQFNDFSEGHKKLILIECITQVLGDDLSLLLLDEPDAHVHIELKKELIKCIENFSGQTILTTHSPIFIEMMNYNNLKYIEDGCGKNMEKIKAITEISNNKLNVLDGAIIASAKRLIVTEGPDDIKHIKKAIDALSRKDTRFEKLKGIPVVFQGGAKLVEEYYNSIISKDINNIEKVVFVFDFDSEGRDGAKLVEKIGNAKIDYVFYNKKYPITSTDYDFYLEDFYSASVYSDIKLPQIVNTPTYYQMKKMATLSKSIKEKLQKKIDNNQISENDFDDFANFFDELLNKFNI